MRKITCLRKMCNNFSNFYQIVLLVPKSSKSDDHPTHRKIVIPSGLIGELLLLLGELLEGNGTEHRMTGLVQRVINVPLEVIQYEHRRERVVACVLFPRLGSDDRHPKRLSSGTYCGVGGQIANYTYSLIWRRFTWKETIHELYQESQKSTLLVDLRKH